MRQHLILERFLSQTFPEFEECAAGNCTCGAGVSCEYDNERRETIGTVPRGIATDARTALGLARKYSDWRDRPTSWSWELTRAVNLAGVFEANFERMKDLEAQRARRANSGT